MLKSVLCKHCLLILAISALGVGGCAWRSGQHPRVKDKPVVAGSDFKGQWWEYFERGRTSAAVKSFSKAATDFRKAIEKKDKDQWRVQTGTGRFLDYFPHRELGVLHFRRGEISKAIDELNTSIQSTPSAKAFYFLNRARAAEIRWKEADRSAPEIAIEGSSGTRITNRSSYTIKGVAEDDTSIASIRVGERKIPIDHAEKRKVFRLRLPLGEGENRIPLTATDLTGKTTMQELAILSDRCGPLVEILYVEGEGDRHVVHGIVSDDFGLKSVAMNNEPWKISGAAPAYNFTFLLPSGHVILTVADKAGNVTRALLSENELQKDPLLLTRTAWPNRSNLFSPSSAAVSDGKRPLLASLQQPETDTDPPSIYLKDLEPDQETYNTDVLLTGIIVDFSPIRTLSVNGRTVAIKKGRKIFFTQLKKLQEGKNTFLVAATDIHGNRAEKTISLVRKVENIRRNDSRLSLAVLPFDSMGATSQDDVALVDQLVTALREQKRFKLVDPRTIEAALDRHGPDPTSHMNHTEIADFGHRVAADAILTGTISTAAESLEIVGHIVDTATGDVLASKDIFTENKNSVPHHELLDELAKKFNADFPLLEGIVVEVNGDQVVLNIGAKDRVRPGMRFICYRRGLEMKHPVTGELLDAEPEIIGELQVREVSDLAAKARLVQQKGAARKYDLVIAK